MLSSPVADGSGNMVVIVGENARKVLDAEDEHVGFEVGGVSLVSISPNGVERWATRIGAAGTVEREVERPSIAPSGDVWACVDADLQRFSSDGNERWSLEGFCAFEGIPGVAYRHRSGTLAGDGRYYFLGSVVGENDDGKKTVTPELRAASPNGDALWTMNPGVASVGEGGLEGGFESGSQIVAPSVGPDGDVWIGCDTCRDGAALAKIDPDSGVPSVVGALGDSATGFHSGPVWDGQRWWIDHETEVWSVASDGNAQAASLRGLPLTASSHAVYRRWDGQKYPDQQRLMWDDSEVDLNGLTADGRPLHVAVPVALAAPSAVVMLYRAAHVSRVLEVPCEAECGLYVLSHDREVIWHRDQVAPGTNVPFVGNGFLVYVNDQHELVSESAPVNGLAAGPWPTLGADAGNTNSAGG